VVIDDRGFGQSSAFSEPINMLMVERLASEGLRYDEFLV
jgi:arylsulfatase A-like enzyme